MVSLLRVHLTFCKSCHRLFEFVELGNGVDVVGWNLHEPISFLSQLTQGSFISRGGCKELTYISRQASWENLSYQRMVATRVVKKLLE